MWLKQGINEDLLFLYELYSYKTHCQFSYLKNVDKKHFGPISGCF